MFLYAILFACLTAPQVCPQIGTPSILFEAKARGSNEFIAIAADAPLLTVIDESGKTHSITLANLSRLARRNVKVAGYSDVEVEFEGVSLVDVLKSVGVVFGKELKGPRSPTVALIDAADGYRVAITLLEIDPVTTETLAILADCRDGKPLGEKEGPLRLVIPTDKRQVRSIRMIRTIRLVNLKDFGAGEPAKPVAPPATPGN